MLWHTNLTRTQVIGRECCDTQISQEVFFIHIKCEIWAATTVLSDIFTQLTPPQRYPGWLEQAYWNLDCWRFDCWSSYWLIHVNPPLGESNWPVLLFLMAKQSPDFSRGIFRMIDIYIYIYWCHFWATSFNILRLEGCEVLSKYWVWTRWWIWWWEQ